jgi:hypothetical protein
MMVGEQRNRVHVDRLDPYHEARLLAQPVLWDRATDPQEREAEAEEGARDYLARNGRTGVVDARLRLLDAVVRSGGISMPVARELTGSRLDRVAPRLVEARLLTRVRFFPKDLMPGSVPHALVADSLTVLTRVIWEVYGGPLAKNLMARRASGESLSRTLLGGELVARLVTLRPGPVLRAGLGTRLGKGLGESSLRVDALVVDRWSQHVAIVLIMTDRNLELTMRRALQLAATRAVRVMLLVVAGDNLRSAQVCQQLRGVRDHDSENTFSLSTSVAGARAAQLQSEDHDAPSLSEQVQLAGQVRIAAWTDWFPTTRVVDVEQIGRDFDGWATGAGGQRVPLTDVEVGWLQ